MSKKLLLAVLCTMLLILPVASVATAGPGGWGSGCNIWKFFVTATDMDGYTETFGPYNDWAEAEAAQQRILDSNWRIVDAYIHEEEYCFNP